MIRVVGVRFKKAGKVYYFDPTELTLTVGARVVVETARGIEYGEIAVGPKDIPEDQVVQPLKKVLRAGTERDAQVHAENKRKEKEAFSIAQKKILAHNLEMTLCDVEYTFDSSKNIFYFTAEGRVDFRELVRDLASVFRTRIEMRQIGVRDEAKLLGGIGPCGRILCCTSFLGDFAPVSIRMAKDQNLSLNPSKISGLCGRLMCCLRYEQDTYEAAKKDPTLAPGYMPPVQIPSVAEAPVIDDEEETRPAIGIRHSGEAGVSARIARAAGLPEPRRAPQPENARTGHTGERSQTQTEQRRQLHDPQKEKGLPLGQSHGTGVRKRPPHERAGQNDESTRQQKGHPGISRQAQGERRVEQPKLNQQQGGGGQPPREQGAGQQERPQGQHRRRRHRNRPRSGGDQSASNQKPVS